MVLGVEYYSSTEAYDFLYGYLADLDIAHPKYGAELQDTFPLFSDENTIQAYAVYFQDLMSIGEHFKFLAGGRYDMVNIDSYDRLSDEQVRDQDDNSFSYQLGLVYQPTRQTSLYASYSTSFLPIASGRKSDGSFLDPETGVQYEVGVKQTMFDGKASATLSAFNIIKQDVSTTDPYNTAYQVQVGEQESRGLELEIAGSLTPNLSLIASAAYVDAEVTQDNIYDEGSELPGVPEWSGSLWCKYALPWVKGLSLGAGLYAASERQPSIDNLDWHLPGYVRFDAMAAYQYDRWTLQLNLKNITDEDIYDLSSTAIMPQQSRTVILTLKCQLW
jgi:iron complex outermembrane receptor protein